MTSHLVTGAGSGIGYALATQLRDRGDHLVLLVRTADRVDELRDTFPDADFVIGDLASPEGLADAVGPALPDRLDSVLHVAGIVEIAPVAAQPLADVQAQLTVNLAAPAELTRLALPAVRRACGTIVFVNSTSGLVANAGWSAYAASKFGLRGFADALRAEEAPYGVRVTSAYPSRTATPMQAKVHAQEGQAYDAGNWMQPESVAAQILTVLDLPRDATVTELTLRTGPRER